MAMAVIFAWLTIYCFHTISSDQSSLLTSSFTGTVQADGQSFCAADQPTLEQRTTTMIRCSARCISYNQCLYFNYNVSSGDCQLYFYQPSSYSVKANCKGYRNIVSIEVPPQVQGYVQTNITFQCPTSTYLSRWLWKPFGSSVTLTIAENCQSLGSHYMAANVTNACNLTIQNAALSDSGVYTCQDQVSGMNTFTKDLTVLDNPKCKLNATAWLSVLTMRNTLFTCSVAYNGTYPPSLSFNWTNASGVELGPVFSNVSDTQAAGYTLKFMPMNPSTIEGFNCTVVDLINQNQIRKCATLGTGKTTCPPFFFRDNINYKCYRVISQPQSWAAAVANCEQQSPEGSIVKIANESERIYISSVVSPLIKNLAACKDSSNRLVAWIGGRSSNVSNCNSSFSWVPFSSWLPEPMSVTDWVPGEPNCNTGPDSCVAVSYNDSLQWIDFDCSMSLCSLCEYRYAAG